MPRRAGGGYSMPNDRQSLKIHQRHSRGATVLVAHGHVDLSTRLKFSTALNEAVSDGNGPVVVDLCEVDFIDSTGIGVLLNALRRLTRQGRPLSVICPPGAVRRVFEVTGLESTLKIHDDIEAGLKAVGSRGDG